MFRNLFCVGLVIAIGVSLATAEEFTGSIKKIGDGKVTVTKVKKGEKGEDVTLSVAANVKVLSSKFNKETKKLEAGDALPGGLSNDIFKNIGEKGVLARIITDDGNKNVTEIRVFGGKKKDNK